MADEASAKLNLVLVFVDFGSNNSKSFSAASNLQRAMRSRCSASCSTGPYHNGGHCPLPQVHLSRNVTSIGTDAATG
jgi:hypothetical protein